jgi:hypothetical protein
VTGVAGLTRAATAVAAAAVAEVGVAAGAISPRLQTLDFVAKLE